jgi:hypothetical protein
MTKISISLSAAAMLVAAAALSAAQTKTIQKEMRTMSATVEAIDAATRQVTVKKQDGTHEVFYVPPSVKRFDMLKVGDRINARHYENVVLRVQAPGEKPIDRAAKETVTPAAQGTGGTIAHQRTITATITAIDNQAPSITFTGPGGYKYSSRVNDTAALAKVKVGDKVDITWTEATLVSIEDAQ